MIPVLNSNDFDFDTFINLEILLNLDRTKVINEGKILLWVMFPSVEHYVDYQQDFPATWTALENPMGGRMLAFTGSCKLTQVRNLALRIRSILDDKTLIHHLVVRGSEPSEFVYLGTFTPSSDGSVDGLPVFDWLSFTLHTPVNRKNWIKVTSRNEFKSCILDRVWLSSNGEELYQMCNGFVSERTLEVVASRNEFDAWGQFLGVQSIRLITDPHNASWWRWSCFSTLQKQEIGCSTLLPASGPRDVYAFGDLEHEDFEQWENEIMPVAVSMRFFHAFCSAIDSKEFLVRAAAIVTELGL